MHTYQISKIRNYRPSHLVKQKKYHERRDTKSPHFLQVWIVSFHDSAVGDVGYLLLIFFLTLTNGGYRSSQDVGPISR